MGKDVIDGVSFHTSHLVEVNNRGACKPLRFLRIFSERILWCGSKKNWSLLRASRVNRKPKTKDFNSSFWFRFGLRKSPVQIYLIRGTVGFSLSAIRSGTSYTNQGQEIRSYLIWTAQECPDNHVSNPVIVRGPFVVCVKTDLHEGGLEENIRMLNLDETFQNYIHFG